MIKQTRGKTKKRVLITGGTGFLGFHLAQKLKSEYEVLLGARNNKQNFKIAQATGCLVVPLDVSNLNSVRDTIGAYKPHIIIHAAATKFVDLAEREPMECVDINVVGSQNVARTAIDKGVEIVIGISTDKASPPAWGTYGLTKALMEKMFCALDAKSQTRFACVRYGNVVWSTGSVLTIWKKISESSGTYMTTGPELKRFFFSVDEAVNLVINAINHIDKIHGKVLSREMKASKMGDIVRVWKKYKGGKWTKIPPRPGERIDEFLISKIELPYTEAIVFDKVTHYMISTNARVANPIKESVSTINAKRLSDREILAIINNPPDSALL